MSNPYFNTYLFVEMCVKPSQMNSNIKSNIKQQLIKNYKGKCFYDYGYIADIYSIQDDIGDGDMRAEDTSASSYYNIEFKAKLCNPMKGSIIVARIDGINKHMILAKNGSINAVISDENINPEKFIYNNSKNALYPIDNNKKEINEPVVQGTYVLIKILEKKIVNMDNKITVLASLEGIATNNDIKTNIINENNQNDQFIKYDKRLEEESEYSKNKNNMSSISESTE